VKKIHEIMESLDKSEYERDTAESYFTVFFPKTSDETDCFFNDFSIRVGV